METRVIKPWRAILCALVALMMMACSQGEKEEEPDYDSMVFLDDAEEDEWVKEEFKDRKIIAQDDHEPQEQILVEPMGSDLEGIVIE